MVIIYSEDVNIALISGWEVILYYIVEYYMYKQKVLRACPSQEITTDKASCVHG